MRLPERDLFELPESTKRFPDGAQYRVEIPSTEGPGCLRAVVEEAKRLNVVVHRVSQGSGVFMLTDRELDEMASLGRSARIELSLFARPNAGWDTSAMAKAPAGSIIAAAARGQDQLVACLDDALRAAEHGIRSVLIADLGVLWVFDQLRHRGVLPTDMQAKVSVMLPAANAASARVLEKLGSAVDVPLDVYVESPDSLGGFVRLHEIPEIIRVAAPVYLKFGLRNAPDIYPSGTHLEDLAIRLGHERVRRARLGLDLLKRSGYPAKVSELGASGLALPSA
jgi:hypothetical protein